MKETLRLNIPVPCGEDWDAMLPEEKGRHCQQCCKTVVDFTGMTDEEVLGFFKDRAGGAGSRAGLGRGEGGGLGRGEGVCGRFFGDQLGRDLAPMPVQRNGVKGWPWVVASALMLGKGPDGGRPVKPAVEMRGMGSVGEEKQVWAGEVGVDVDTPVRTVPDTSVTMVTMGMPEVLVGDVKVDVLPDGVLIGKIAAHDTVAEMPADTVTAAPIKKSRDELFTGLVRIVPDTPLYSRKPMDTVSRIKALADTVVNILKDTVAAVVPELAPAFQREDLLKVYPNPVPRGGMIRLAWRGEAGSYSAAFYDLHGQMVQERMIDVAGKGQVDEWAVPNGLAAGVYFLRVVRPGEKGYTVEVLVQ